MRLIDADKLVNSLENNLQSFEKLISKYGKGLVHGTRIALNRIAEQPTISPESLQPQWIPATEPYTAKEDLQPATPAHWGKADIPLPYQVRTIPTPSGTFTHMEMYVCSACDGYNDKNTQYCPHCGAKMDKEVNDDD